MIERDFHIANDAHEDKKYMNVTRNMRLMIKWMKMVIKSMKILQSEILEKLLTYNIIFNIKYIDYV